MDYTDELRDRFKKKVTDRAPGKYKSDGATDKARQELAKNEKRPGAYREPYPVKTKLREILQNKDVPYQFNADALYREYQDQYAYLSDLAQADTESAAEGLSGGYGADYAGTVAAQSFNAYRAKANEALPEYEALHYEQEKAVREDLYRQLSALQETNSAAYEKHRDTVEDYYTDLNYYYTRYGALSAQDYSRYLQNIEQWQNDRAYYYQQILNYNERKEARADNELRRIRNQKALEQ